MTLAYMAEIGVVFNLAYAELKATRYLGKTMKRVIEFKLRLTDDLNNLPASTRSNTQPSYLDECHELKLKLGNFFCQTEDAHAYAWCVKSSQILEIPDGSKTPTTKSFSFESRWIYPWFACSTDQRTIDDIVVRVVKGEDVQYDSRDKRTCTILMTIAVIVLITCTVLSQAENFLLAELTTIITPMWWVFFSTLFAAIVMPALLVVAGRALSTKAELITNHFQEQYNTASEAYMTKRLEISQKKR